MTRLAPEFIFVFLLIQALRSTCDMSVGLLSAEQPPCIFPNGSIACKVWNHTNLDCRRRNLVCVPPLSHARSVKLLDLSANQLRFISKNTFSRHANLLHLSLATNQISILQDGSFSGLHALLSLDLEDNRLSALRGNVFSELYELQSLNLSSNNLCFFNDSIFHRLRNFDILKLSNNRLHTLDGSPDVFSELHNLQSLDLSSNIIRILDNNSFSGLRNLHTLTLSSSLMEHAVLGSPFQDLVSLQTLNLESNSFHTLRDMFFVGLHNLQTLTLDGTRITSVANGTFAELSNLRILKITFFGLDNPYPFAGLKSLQELILTFSFESRVDCDNIERCLRGLQKLEKLTITQNGWPFVDNCSAVINVDDFGSLSSLQSLYMTGVNIQATDTATHFTTIPLKHLSVQPSSINNHVYPPYKMFQDLTSLSLTIYSDFHTTLQAVDSLDSPVEKLDITLFIGMVTLNSSTFASCMNWNMTLFKLEILCMGCREVRLKSSPFLWFPNLRSLRLSNFFRPNNLIMSRDTFKGLENLQELSISDSVVKSFEWQALDIFSRYNSLKSIRLTSNKISGIVHNQLCSISSLQTLDLSQNGLDGFAPNVSSRLPNLTILYINKQSVQFSYWSFKEICEVAPNLVALYAMDIYLIDMGCSFHTCMCYTLKILELSFNLIYYYVEPLDEWYLPQLEEMYLHNVGSPYSQNIKILTIFKTPQLRHLEFYSNDVSVIDKEDAQFFSNLTYLDLSNNRLTSLHAEFFTKIVHLDLTGNQLSSVSNILDVQNVDTLLLGKNKLKVVPKSFLSKSNLPNMHVFDLSQNPFDCDCNVEVFKKWLLTDKVVYLQNSVISNNIYQCAYPDFKKGLSVTEVKLDCESNALMYIVVSIMCVVVMIALGFLVIWYRWHIQYRLFLLLNRRQIFLNNVVRNDDEDDDEEGDPRYDAYVTYHRGDEDWVADELEVNLEGGEEPFRLCIKNRDIQAGRLIFNALTVSMQRSRKILVILSPRFVDDNWCYFELNMAHHRVLMENSNVLIFIILEDLPDDKMTLLLRQLFDKVKCFKWPADEYEQDLFWQGLREELKRPVPVDRRFHV